MEIYIQKIELIKIENNFNSLINNFPTLLINKLKIISNKIKKIQRFYGLQLIEKMVVDNNFSIKKYNLKNLKISEFGKPFFDSNFDFSLSYSEDIAVLGFQENGKIGVDIEHIKPINLIDFNDYFNDNELNFLNTSSSLFSDFYKLWTRKEAISKGLGLGFYLDFKTINSLQDHYINDLDNWQIESKLYDNKYWISTAVLVN